MHDVFISYSHKNKAIADAMCHALEAGNERGKVQCWCAPRNIQPGDNWEDAIVNAIQSSRIFILIFSESSNTSTQVHKEITQAIQAGCITIPFRIDDTQMCNAISYNLADAHWLDAITDPNQFAPLLDTILRYLRSESITALKITPPAKTQYRVGESLQTDGMTVTAVYTDGTTEDVTSRITVNTRNFQNPGTVTVTVRYSGKKAVFTVEVYSEKEPAAQKKSAVYEKKRARLLGGWIFQAYLFLWPAGLLATVSAAFGKKFPFFKKASKAVSILGVLTGIVLLALAVNEPDVFEENFPLSILGLIIKYFIL